MLLKATASVVPQHWQPNSGLLMTNDASDTNSEEAVPCIALSKNDSYVMSACGGKISLFNMMTFKVVSVPISNVTYFVLNSLCQRCALLYLAGNDNIHVPPTSFDIFSIPSTGQQHYSNWNGRFNHPHIQC